MIKSVEIETVEGMFTMTFERLKSLKKAYTEAVEKGDSEFTWKGLDFVTGYAKYLIEALEARLGEVA